MRSAALAIVSGIVTLIVGLPGCGTADTAISTGGGAARTFVGRTKGGEALVAVVEGPEGVVGYTCGVGESFGTHTGWYSGVRAGDAEIQAVNGPSDLRMRLVLDVSGGSGAMRLPDGREVAFDVEPARGAAGLFDYEDAGRFVGLVRTNDGQTAGNSVLRISSSGTTLTSPTSTPVTTTTTTPTTTTVTTVSASFDSGGAITTVNLTPTSPSQRIVTRTGPVVVFLMHGMADNLGMAPAGSAENLAECAGPKDTPFYGRCEWGQDFLPGLFGTRDVRTQLTTLDGRDVTGDRFLSDPTNRQLFDENLGKRMDGDCNADPTEAERFDVRTAMHFVVPGKVTSPVVVPPDQIKLPPPPPQIAAFVTWRDPTRGMVFSGRRVTRQIYAALRWYEATYRVTPGVILLAQSFGGLASRFLLSKPDPSLLDGDTNREGVRLCKEDLAKMDYVRDRVLYLLTLATPHEGSYLAEWGPPVKDALRALLTELRQGIATSNIAQVARAMDQIATLLRLDFTPNLVDQAVSSINGFLPQLESAAALIDMQLARMVKFNRGPISPERARRSGASPILGAQKTLVPVYATLARSPGSNAFDSPDILRGFRTYQRKRAKVRGWIGQTMLVSDQLTRQLVPKGFGDAKVAPYAEFADILDRRARLFDSSPTTEQVERAFASDITSVLRTVSPWFLGKFGRGADAVIAGLNREVSVALPHVSIPIHVDQRWSIGFSGSIEVPIPALQCGTRRIPLDLTPLARLLVDTYGRTPDVLAAIQNKDLRAVLEALSVVIAETDTFAKQVADWFVAELAQLRAQAPLPTECDARPDNVFDVFAAAELANWRVVAGTGRIPAPAWIPTGEPVSDGEMDTDGAVHSASALGFTLGRVPFFFEHDRLDDAGRPASWYRLYDNPVTEKYNHGLQYENEVGLWVQSTFLVPKVGPVPARDTFSVWVD